MNTIARLAAVLVVTTLGFHSTTATANGMAFGRWQPPAALEGTWVVSIRPIFCSGPSVGNDVPGIPPVVSYLTFGRGGTLVESTSNPNFGVGARSSGHGGWERTGRTSYQFMFQAFLNEPLAPYLTGHQRIDQTVEMHSMDDWSSSGTVQFFSVFDKSATPNLAPYRAGCARSTGVRLY
jgi:hypothetical protein